MRVQSFARALAAAAVLASSLAACAPAANREAVAVPATVQGAVALADGGELRIEETRGHVVVLAFFTTWCPASPAALRAVEELRTRNAGRDLEVIAVGEGTSAEEVSAFANKLGVRAAVAFDMGGALASQLRLPTVPAVIVIARDGTIRHVHAGYHGEDDRTEINREVTALLEAAMPSEPGEPAQRVARQ